MSFFWWSKQKYCITGKKKKWKVIEEIEAKWGNASFKKVWLIKDIAGFKTAHKSLALNVRESGIQWRRAFENVLFVLYYYFNNFEELQHSISVKGTEFGEKR